MYIPSGHPAAIGVAISLASSYVSVGSASMSSKMNMSMRTSCDMWPHLFSASSAAVSFVIISIRSVIVRL